MAQRYSLQRGFSLVGPNSYHFKRCVGFVSALCIYVTAPVVAHITAIPLRLSGVFDNA